MNRDDVKTLLGKIRASWPQAMFPPDADGAWYEQLMDVPLQSGRDAYAHFVQKGDHRAPTLGQFRAKALGTSGTKTDIERSHEQQRFEEQRAQANADFVARLNSPVWEISQEAKCKLALERAEKALERLMPGMSSPERKAATAGWLGAFDAMCAFYAESKSRRGIGPAKAGDMPVPQQVLA